MAFAYRDPNEYLQEVLDLVQRRLAWLQNPPEQTDDQALPLELRREEQIRRRCEATVDAGGAAPLEYLFRSFGLTAFERHCVYFSLAPELDAAYEQVYADGQSDRCRLPSLSLCVQCFPAAPEERPNLLAQWRRRREWLDFFFSGGHKGLDLQSDLTAGLKLERRVCDFLFDYNGGDEALLSWTEIFWPKAEGLAPLAIRGELLERMEQAQAAAVPGEPLLFFLRGDPGAGRRTLARHFCLGREQPLLTAEVSGLLRSPLGWEKALLALCRETAIRGAALALVGFELLLASEDAPPVREEDEPARRAISQDGGNTEILRILTRAAQVTNRLFLLSRQPWQPTLPCPIWRKIELALDMPDTAGRIRLWQQYLPATAQVQLSALATKFALQPGQVAAAAQEADYQGRCAGEDTLTEARLYPLCRAQLSHSLGKKAAKVNAAYTWEDLILPPLQKRQLENACAQVEYRHKVYDQWGFGKKVAYGQGLSMLFTGPPGTGKTMAAQVLANRLQLELYKVDLSGVVSKYIGETEKQLGAVFDEVKKSQSILFFDEADALFGKRSETKDSHDRYANVQTSYLLQKMEEYDGIVILTSNFQQNFDEAFNRRIKFIIDFPLPDRERREEIWRSVMPPDMPRQEDIDFDFLARSFELSGSSIKNIVVSAAFLAAAEQSAVQMTHLLLATQSEQQKTGKSMSRSDFGEYYHQISNRQ